MKLPRPTVTTRAFDEWALVLRDIEGFFHTGHKMTDHHIDYVTEQMEDARAGDAPPLSVEEYTDRLFEAFEQTSPADFIWMLSAATIKDAVTAYELYCQHAADEILNAHGLVFNNLEHRYPVDWVDLAAFFRSYIDCELSPEPIARFRSLRHLLTHRRGALRLERDRLQFGNEPEDWTSGLVQLGEKRVEEILTGLDEHVLSMDPTVHRHSWGKVEIARLREIRLSLTNE